MGGCDRVKEKVKTMMGRGTQVDTRWVRDSAFVASPPGILFRVMPKGTEKHAVPIARYGTVSGLQPLRMTDRGWRAFDVAFFYSGNELTALRNGRSIGPVKTIRGMWEQPQPLDTFPDCREQLAPSALVKVDDDVRLLVRTASPPVPEFTPLSPAALDDALSTIRNLVAPKVGLTGAVLSTFRREVYQVPSPTPGFPYVVALYNDPVSLPDTASPITNRPRHLVVVLGKGIYGYQPRYVSKTTGVARDLRPLKWLDYLDVNNDGHVELLFGLQDPRSDIYTIVLHYQNDSWREVFRRDHLRCVY